MASSLATAPPESAAEPTVLGAPGSAQPGVVGAVEVVTATRIAGWAADRAAADRRLTVELLADGAMLGRVTAERPRDDLARSGPGDGRHGFELRCPEPLSGRQLERIEAFVLVGAEAARVALPVRRPDGSFPAMPRPTPAPPPWVAELATLCRTIERHARRLDEDPAPAQAVAHPGEAVELRELLARLAGRIESLEALHPRLDALAARLDDLAHSALVHGRPQRGLAWAVALTAGLALASLGTGIAGYWF